MPTSAEAQAHIAAMGARQRRPLPAFVMQNADPVFVFNIYNRRHERLWNGRKFIIAANPEGQKYTRTRFPGVIAEEYDLADGQGNMSSTAHEARKVIQDDIIGLKSYAPKCDLMTTNLEWWGVLMSLKEVPTDAELRQAKERLVKFMTLFVEEGDRLYAQRNPNFQPIEIHREAASWLGLKREWNTAPLQMIECPGCGTSIKPTVAKCASCGAILDRKKAMELGLIPNEATAPVTAPASV